METVSDITWRKNASCKGVDPNIFVPTEGRGEGRHTYNMARLFCSTCEVKAECLEYALKENMEFGMYGGTTPRERRSLKREFVKTGSD